MPSMLPATRSLWPRAARPLLVSALAAALATAGCGGDDDQSTSTTVASSAAATTAAAVAGATVTGTVTAPDGLPALPDGTTLSVTLDEFPADGAAGTTVDEVVIEVTDADFPVAFELNVEEVDEASGYGVTAIAQSGDELVLIGNRT